MSVSVAGMMGARGVQSLSALALAVMIARLLGPEGNGLYAVAVLIPSLLATLLECGVGAGTIYFVGRGDVSLRHAYGLLLSVWVWVSVAGLAVASVAASVLPHEDLIPARLLWPALFFFPVMLLQVLLATLLQAVQDFRSYNLTQLVSPLVTLGCAGAGLLLLQLGVESAVWSFGLGQLAGVLVTWRVIRSRLPADEASAPPFAYRRNLLGYGWKSHASSVMSFLSYRADILLITWLVGAAAAGVYVVAVSLVERLWLLSQTTSAVVFPRLAHLANDEDARKTLTPIVSRWVFGASVVGALLLLLLADPVINFLFGPEFSAASTALYILLPGVVALAVSRILASDLAARGRVEINMYLALAATVINIVANLILIPIWGILGAAAATTLSYSLNTGAKVIIQTRLSGGRWWRLFAFERRDWFMLQAAAQRLVRRAT